MLTKAWYWAGNCRRTFRCEVFIPFMDSAGAGYFFSKKLIFNFTCWKNKTSPWTPLMLTLLQRIYSFPKPPGRWKRPTKNSSNNITSMWFYMVSKYSKINWGSTNSDFIYFIPSVYIKDLSNTSCLFKLSEASQHLYAFLHVRWQLKWISSHEFMSRNASRLLSQWLKSSLE